MWNTKIFKNKRRKQRTKKDFFICDQHVAVFQYVSAIRVIAGCQIM